MTSDALFSRSRSQHQWDMNYREGRALGDWKRWWDLGVMSVGAAVSGRPAVGQLGEADTQVLHGSWQALFGRDVEKDGGRGRGRSAAVLRQFVLQLLGPSGIAQGDDEPMGSPSVPTWQEYPANW